MAHNMHDKVGFVEIKLHMILYFPKYSDTCCQVRFSRFIESGKWNKHARVCVFGARTFVPHLLFSPPFIKFPFSIYNVVKYPKISIYVPAFF